MAGAARVGQARSLGATRSPPGTGLTFIHARLWNQTV